MQIRPYQQQLIEKSRKCKSSIIVLGCGGGKSVIASEIARLATNKKNKVLFLVHRKEICEQIEKIFILNNVNFDYCDIKMIQSYRRNLGKYEPPNVIIIDEAHTNKIAYKNICEYYPEAVKIGFTATPVNMAKSGYDNLIKGVTTQWLIENKYLAPYKYYSVRLAKTDKLHVKQGDFDKQEIAELMQQQEIYGNTVEQWEKLAKGKKTIVYCSSIQASKDTCSEFIAKGYSCYHLDGSTPKKERKIAVERFRNGEIQILCNMDLFGVGFDVPDCECTILLRPTKSLALFIQQSMRSMRYKEDKTAIIIDHVGNAYLHGLPDDEREWSLQGRAKQENIVKVKECQTCFAVYKPNVKSCPFCGEVSNIIKQTKGRKTIDIDLVELERKNDLIEIPLKDFKGIDWEDVVEYQQLKKYKFGWAIRYATKNKINIPKKYNYMKKKYINL